ncbi:hypothetical protein [Rhodanobacter ginsengiterrae]|uniref:hypothetical protein n=1 Tax=Rhodanobacter ginsengiterrae TaxID=2008451 RepID=UPI003CE8112E
MKKWILWIAPLALAACSAQTKFIPRGQNLATTAHLIADSDLPGVFLKQGEHYVVFESVDGKPIHGYWDLRVSSNELYLMPGSHTFDVSYVHAGAVARGRFAIQAKAGETYLVHHEVHAYSVRFWVTKGLHGTELAATPLPTG